MRLALVALNLLLLAAVTLRPSSDNASFISPTCILCGERGSADLILNIVLFVPLGAALGHLGWRRLKVGLAALLIAAAIELAQVVIPGRSPTLRDIAMNATGAWLGAALLQALWSAPRARWAPPLAWVAAACGVLAIAATGWVMQPAVKRNGWYGHLAPRLAHLEPFAGRIERVQLGREVMRHGYLRQVDAVHRAVAAQQPIRIDGIAGPRTTRLAGLFVISDEEFEEMLLIGQQGHDLILRERRRASILRLFEPELRIERFFASLPEGTPFRLEVRFAPTHACATLSDAASATCTVRIPASSAWTLLLWRRFWSDNVRAVFGFLTLATLFFPAGLCAAALSWTARAALTAASAIGVWGAARSFDLAAPTFGEMSGLLAGLLLGAALGLYVRRADGAASVPTHRP